MKKITSFLFIMIFYASSLQGVSLEKTIKMTLSNNPNILIQKEQVNYFKGQYLLSTYPFDLKLSLSSSAQKDKAITSFFSTQNKSTINHNLSVNKYLESGYFLESGLDFSYQRTSYNSNLLSKQNQNSIYFTLKKPLLKNTSKDIVTSGKTLAQYDLDISYLNYDNQINDSVYNSIVMYWNLVYANEKYKLDVKLQKRAKDLLTNIKYLIKSDIKPKSDLLQPEANLNSKAISTLASKQNLISLKNDLGLHLGVELDTYYDEKKLQSFPKPDTEDISTLDTQTSYFHTCGMTNRNDLKTQYVKIKKSQLELKMAKDSLKSDLDLTFRVSITGANEDGDLITSVGNLYNNDIRGNSIYLGLQYEVPVNNSLARGNYLSSLSSLKMKKIELSHIKRTIVSDIDDILNNIKITLLSYQKSEKSIEKYKLFFENEKVKYKMGLSTIMDLIQSEDYLYSEEVKRLNILKTYATQIAKLRYVAADIIHKKEENFIDSRIFLYLDRSLN